MYEAHWNLTQKPFENTSDPRFYYPSESHQAALLKLRYAVENQRGGAMLAGTSGSGKTLLTGMLRQTLNEGFAPFVHLVFPQMPCPELLAYLADALEGSPNTSAGCSVQESIRRIERFLAGNAEQNKHAVVAIDEAHLIQEAPTLETLRLLLNFEWNGRPALTLLLVGQAGLIPTLERMPQLDQRLGVKCLIRPFSEQETAEYVVHRLDVAGANREIFEPDALSALYALTHGLARQINRLCDLVLLIGYAEERRTITAAQLEAVSQELVAVVPE